MSTIINADTSDGLKFTSDTSGEIKLQSAGTDIATVSSTGITMASGKLLAATGHVLQVVQGLYGITTATNSNVMIDTGLSVSITPSSASSKILIIAQHGDAASEASAVGLNVQLMRNSTQIPASKYFSENQMYGQTAGSGYNIGASQTIVYLDSPSTTSAITYKTQFCSESSGTNVILFRDNTQGTIIAMEIAG